MANILTFSLLKGTITFDFDQKIITINREGLLAGTAKLDTMEINMEEITHIELRQPSALKLGAFSFIINNTRYTTPSNYYATLCIVANTEEFPFVQTTLQRVLGVAKLTGFYQEDQVMVPTQIFNGPVEEGLVYTLINNTNSVLKLYEDHLIIKHSGALNFIIQNGLKGEKRINYASISSIEFKKATKMTAGFLQFSIMGSGVRGGVGAALSDENSIIFDVSKNELAQTIVEYVEKRRTEITRPQSQQVVQSISAADEILKFKQLLDQGIISEKEFEAKKKQILGV